MAWRKFKSRLILGIMWLKLKPILSATWPSFKHNLCETCHGLDLGLLRCRMAYVV
jgi:hypothetical protein